MRGGNTPARHCRRRRARVVQHADRTCPRCAAPITPRHRRLSSVILGLPRRTQADPELQPSFTMRCKCTSRPGEEQGLANLPSAIAGAVPPQPFFSLGVAYFSLRACPVRRRATDSRQLSSRVVFQSHVCASAVAISCGTRGSSGAVGTYTPMALFEELAALPASYLPCLVLIGSAVHSL